MATSTMIDDMASGPTRSRPGWLKQAGRAGAIAVGALFYNDPKRVLTDLDRYRAVKAKDIQRVATEYLNGNWVFYELVPAGKAAGGAAPTTTPAPTTPDGTN